ncbi:hypothetical protein AB0M80_08965 [Amycolatopsis sp. NPDC051045]|uniref:hypothetical protein n=1 Tax=Amycolatopsis sp. NPDC051045 TaxID=3156922 RepID=UPI00342B2DD3
MHTLFGEMLRGLIDCAALLARQARHQVVERLGTAATYPAGQPIGASTVLCAGYGMSKSHKGVGHWPSSCPCRLGHSVIIEHKFDGVNG